MVNVIATIRAKAGKEKETELLLRGLLKPTHAEVGCIKYALHRRENDPSYFYFVESWKTSEDLENHLASAHLANLKARSAELFAHMDVARVELLEEGASEKGKIGIFKSIFRFSIENMVLSCKQ